MVNLYGISNILTAIASTAMAVFVYIKGYRSKLCRIWSIFAICVAIYGFGAYMASGAKNYESAFFWWQVSYVGVILLPPLFVHFVYVFLESKRSILVLLVYIISIFLLAADIFSKDLFIGNVSLLFTDSTYFKEAWWVYPPGPLHVFYTLVLYAGFLMYAHIKLLKAYRNATLLKRYQIKYFFLATALGFIGGGTSYLPCFGINIYPVLNITVPLYPLIMGYAIIRHQLMDIEVIIKKTIVFASLFLITFGIFVAITLITQELIAEGSFLGLAISAIVIIAGVRPLEDLLVKMTDKYLFQKKYDYKKLLKTFTDEVITVLDLNKLVNLTVNNLADIMKLENATILLRDGENEEYRIVASAGLEDAEYELSYSDEIIARMKDTGEYIHIESTSAKKFIDNNIKRNVLDLQAVLVIPLLHQNNMVGMLALGKKKSDEEFAQDDIDILLPLAKTLSIAITNAQLFEKLSEAQAQAAQREKMAVIGTLSAGINHEICNPLGIARGQCEMFLLNLKEGIYKDKKPEELVEKASDIMQKVINETDRATVITKKLSSFAKPSSGIMSDDVDVEKELNEVISLVEHDLKLDNIAVTKEIAEGLPPITADRKQLQEILFNIIRNAAQAIRDRGKISVRATSSNDKVYIDIEDTGTGMSKSHLAQIFNPFFTTKEPGKGTGLGLFIVKQIVERNRGRIAVKSEPGKGTTFYLRFDASGADDVKRRHGVRSGKSR